MEYKNRTKELRERMHTEILDMLLDPTLTLEEIARRCGCTLTTVFNVATKAEMRRKDRKAGLTDLNLAKSDEEK